MTFFIGLSIGILVAVGLIVITVGLRPFRPQLGDALTRIETAVPPVADHTVIQNKAANALRRILPENVPVLAIPYQDLALAGISVEKFLSEKLLGAAAGFGIPLLLGLGLTFSGVVNISPIITVLIALAIGVGGYFAKDGDIKITASSKRVEFTRATAAFVELVAAERRRGVPAGHALLAASEVADSWVFQLIRKELILADLSGVTPWDALEKLSLRMGVPELAQTAQIVRLSSQDGASVYQALRSRGKALRFELLAVDQADANRDSERMQVPIALLSLVVVGIMITPMIQSLLAL